MKNEELKLLETEFENTPIEKVEIIMNNIIYRLKNDGLLEENSKPILRQRVKAYKKYIQQRKKDQKKKQIKNKKVVVKKPLTL